MNLSFRRQQETKRREEKKRSMPWREYWHLYLSLVGTGILTAFAGVYLGLAPSANGDIVFVSTFDAVRRVFFALYYALSFLLVAEGATLFAKDKLLQRDVEEVDDRVQDIAAQRNSMTAMLWVSVLAIVATTVAAGYILAAWLRALDQFVTIPAVAQTWVVVAPPALLVFDAVMALIYQQNSKQSELDRWVQQQKRMAEANAQETFAHEYVNQYNQIAPDAAKRAARTSAMTDARRWAGAGVDEAEVIPSHDQEKALPPPGNLDEGIKKIMRMSGTLIGGDVMEQPTEAHPSPVAPVMERPKIAPIPDGKSPGVFRGISELMVETGMMQSPPHTSPKAGDVVIDDSHDALMASHVVPDPEPEPTESHGEPEPPVVEETPLPPTEAPVEAGTDQPSPT